MARPVDRLSWSCVYHAHFHHICWKLVGRLSPSAGEAEKTQTILTSLCPTKSNDCRDNDSLHWDLVVIIFFGFLGESRRGCSQCLCIGNVDNTKIYAHFSAEQWGWNILVTEIPFLTSAFLFGFSFLLTYHHGISVYIYFSSINCVRGAFATASNE